MQNIKQMEKIHHYTTIDTLALILKTKRIRFNRLDRVDDMIESRIYGKYDMSKYIFVSCWTIQQDESIPQWHIYTNKMRGVRISLDKDMFNYQPLVKPTSISNNDYIIEPGTQSPIPFEELFTDEYFILPIIANKKNLERTVEYVENPYDYYKDVVSVSQDKDGFSTLSIKSVINFGMCKSLDWKFQQEFRFALFILPNLPIPPSGMTDRSYMERQPEFIANSILNGVAPKITHFDVELNSQALDNIEITLGPLNSESDRIIIESLLKEYTKNGKLQLSSLTEKIRTPER